MEPIVSIRNLYYRYPAYEQENELSADPEYALEDLSLDLYEGGFTAIIGHNGSGKSTLAKIINALILPQEGRVTVCGWDTQDESRLWDIRRNAGMIFQNPDNQLVATLVEEDVAFGPENLGIPREEIRRRVDESLEAVGMTAYARHAPHLLSGGQKQRIAIAGVIAMQPRLLLMDEPTAMLDPSGRREVIEAAHRLNREKGITVVLITHFMQEALGADRVVVMDQGKVVRDGAPREVFRHVEELQAIGLEVPPMTELAYLLRREGLSIPEDTVETAEMVEALCPYL